MPSAPQNRAPQIGPRVSARPKASGAPPRQGGLTTAWQQNGANVLLTFLRDLIHPFVMDRILALLIVFYRRLGILVKAGMPLQQALGSLQERPGSAHLAAVLRDCRREVEVGGKLSAALARHNDLFNDIQLSLIRAAEEGGFLDEMLPRLADYLEQEMALRRFLRRQTIYAKIIFVIGVFGIPVLFGAIMGGDLWSLLWGPLNSLLQFAFILCLVYALGRTLLRYSPDTREAYERGKWALPGIGTVARKAALARFGRAFGMLYAAGLTLSAAVRTAGEASGSHLLRQGCEEAARDAEQGEPVTRVFRRSGLFPGYGLELMETGQQSGSLDAMMHKMAEFLEGEVETQGHQVAYIFALVFFLFVAFNAVGTIRFPLSL